jgi:hypothetical protein
MSLSLKFYNKYIQHLGAILASIFSTQWRLYTSMGLYFYGLSNLKEELYCPMLRVDNVFITNMLICESFRDLVFPFNNHLMI